MALEAGDPVGHALLANMPIVREWLATARMPKNIAVWIKLSRKWRKTYVPGIALERKYTRNGHMSTLDRAACLKTRTFSPTSRNSTKPYQPVHAGIKSAKTYLSNAAGKKRAATRLPARQHHEP